MEVGVHPGAVLAGRVHHDLMRLIPMVLAGPPQPGQRRRETARRVRLRERALELSKGHWLPRRCARWLPPRLWRKMPSRVLDHLSEGEQRLFVERSADQLQAERQ